MQSVSKRKSVITKGQVLLSLGKTNPIFLQNFVEDIGKANPLFLSRNTSNPVRHFPAKANPILRILDRKSEHENAPHFPLF